MNGLKHFGVEDLLGELVPGGQSAILRKNPWRGHRFYLWIGKMRIRIRSRKIVVRVSKK